MTRTEYKQPGRKKRSERTDTSNKEIDCTASPGVTLNVAIVAQGSLTYPPGFTLPFNSNVHPYRMPQGWNTNIEEQPAAEGHKQVGMNNVRIGPTEGSGTGPIPASRLAHTRQTRALPLVDQNR
ncbi:hypothetical protein CR513_56726, partial [Mucuna pruriens]